MKKIVISALAALTLGCVAATAGDIQFYVDDKGQVFTQAAEGRTALENKQTPVYSHTDKLKFSGLAYLGYKNTNYKSAAVDDINSFELRRMYFQVKAYLLEDPKSFFRITLDTTTSINDDSTAVDEYQSMMVKYAYLYLDEVLPFTGVELGLVHRPWIDYEEHNSWFFRGIQKVFVEDSNSAHLTNSADFGVNFKTKTKYFDSEIGVFQGEGYHDKQIKRGMSFEWRTTAHLLGVNGKDKPTKKTYWDASFYGQYNKTHKLNANDSSGYDDLVFGALHTVFNIPSFQVAGQYLVSSDTAENATYVSKEAGSGYNAHILGRFGADYTYQAFARYDTWTADKLVDSSEAAQTTYSAGFAWDQNKNIQWIANVIVADNETNTNNDAKNGNSYMVTAQVEF